MTRNGYKIQGSEILTDNSGAERVEGEGAEKARIHLHMTTILYFNRRGKYFLNT